MSLILKQEPANTIATPPAGKTTLFVTETNTMATKGPDGNVTTFPTIQGANTQVMYNDDGALNGDSSFTFNKASDLVTVANLTVSGTLIAGDIAVSSIANGTSNVDIVGVSGNVTISVAGNANILTASGTGVNVAGTLNATGNANVGNLGTAGLVVATGNVTGGNLVTGGVLSVTGNANVGNLGTTGNVVAGGIKTDNLYYANGSPWDLQQPAGSNTYVQYNNNDSFGASPSFTYNSDTSTLSATNIAGTLTTASQPNVTSVGTLSSLTVTANIDGGNLTTGGVLSVTGNANVGNLGTAGLLVATGNVTGSNLVTSGNVYTENIVNAGGATQLSMGNGSGILALISGGNSTDFLPSGAVRLDADGAKQIISGTSDGSQLTLGNNDATLAQLRAGNVIVQTGTGGTPGNTWTFAQDGSFTSPGAVSATGNVSGGNLTTTGSANIGNGMTISAGGANITGVTNFTGNLNITGNINATGNLNYSNVTDLVVGDPLIYLGANNTGNLYDLGFVASYNDGSYVHTGIARNHNDGVWTFFDGVAAEPTTTIDWANASYPAVKVGSLTATTTISITGNANVGNLGTAGLVVATGNVTGGNLVTGGVLSVTGNANVGNLGTSGLVVATGNVTGGNLVTGGALSVTGNANVGNLGTAGLVVATGNVTGGNLVTGGVLSVTGNANAGNLGTAGIIVSSIATGTAPFTVASTTRVSNLNVATAGAADTATTAGTVTTAAQPNITSVGTLTSLTVSGTTTISGNAALTTTNITTGANTTAGYITGNFSLTTGSRLNATYADLAEKYVADAEYAPGTVLEFGGEYEVTISNELSTTRVAGVVTTNPAYTMNNECEGAHVAILALQGRVPCKVIGPIFKGDLLVSAGNGHAIANNEARAGTIIGKSLENFNDATGVIEVAVGRF